MIDDYYADLCNEEKVKDLLDAMNVSLKTPLGEKVVDFIQWLCRYNSPEYSTDPNVALMEKAKREVFLTLKTLLRDDVSPKQIADYYKKSGGYNG